MNLLLNKIELNSDIHKAFNMCMSPDLTMQNLAIELIKNHFSESEINNYIYSIYGDILSLTNLNWDTLLTTDELYFDGKGLLSLDLAGYLPNVNYVNLSNNKLKEVNYLKWFPNLKYVNLYNNKIDDLTGLSSSTNLISFVAHYNNITDISEVENLNNLIDLQLSNNKIKNIDSLKNLTNLKYIGLKNNILTNVNVLENHINLKSLRLSGNESEAWASIMRIKKLLPSCDVKI